MMANDTELSPLHQQSTNELILDQIESRSSEKMMSKMAFKPSIPVKESRLKALIAKIPFLESFLQNVDNNGVALSKLAQLQSNLSQSAGAAGNSFRFAGLALAIVVVSTFNRLFKS